MKKKKTLAIVIFFTLIASTMAETLTVKAQSKLPTPEFTLTFAHSYYIVTAADPVTGLNQTQQFDNNTININIKNQPYQTSINGTSYHLPYDVRMKLHSEENWSDVYPPVSLYDNSSNLSSTPEYLLRTPNASTSEFTVLEIYDYYPSYPPNTVIDFVPPFHFPPGAQVDLEVEAIIGVDSQAYIPDHPTVPWLGGHYEPRVAVDTISGWSSAQTIKIPETLSSPTLTASLSESASALNYGNTVNFTVTTEGGVPPYSFTWYVDGKVSAITNSPYFSLNSSSVGSHHVYVEVIDANGNPATTLTVEFNVLPTLNPSTSPSPPIPEFPAATTVLLLFSAIIITATITKSRTRSKRNSKSSTQNEC